MPNEVGQLRLQLQHCQRPYPEPICPGAQRLLAKVVVVAPGQENDRHILEGLTRAQALEHIEPVNCRALQIQQQGIRLQ